MGTTPYTGSYRRVDGNYDLNKITGEALTTISRYPGAGYSGIVAPLAFRPLQLNEAVGVDAWPRVFTFPGAVELTRVEVEPANAGQFRVDYRTGFIQFHTAIGAGASFTVDYYPGEEILRPGDFTSTSAGAADADLVVVLDAGGLIDDAMIPGTIVGDKTISGTLTLTGEGTGDDGILTAVDDLQVTAGGDLALNPTGDVNIAPVGGDIGLDGNILLDADDDLAFDDWVGFQRWYPAIGGEVALGAVQGIAYTIFSADGQVAYFPVMCLPDTEISSIMCGFQNADTQAHQMTIDINWTKSATGVTPTLIVSFSGAVGAGSSVDMTAVGGALPYACDLATPTYVYFSVTSGGGNPWPFSNLFMIGYKVNYRRKTVLV